MTGMMHVDPESFGPVATSLRQAADGLHSAWQSVAGESQSVHFGRGDDVLSPLVQAALAGAVSMVDDCMTSCQQALHDYSDGLDRMAATYRTIEAQTVSMLSKG